MNRTPPHTPSEILLIEDNPGDVRLTLEGLKSDKININVVNDGAEALVYLRKKGSFSSSPRPDLILLDLNLPKKNGHEVLTEIKNDPDLKRIPVVIMTGSQAQEDIIKSYKLHANCYVTKPVDVDQFLKVVKTIQEFWFTIVKLPQNES